jgi:phosphoribosylformylglycinamidine synthase
MAQPRVLILRAPGTNCDEETAFAFERAGAAPRRMHVNRLLESPPLLREFEVLCIPGGFSYGDDIAAGRIFASQIQLRLNDAVCEFRERGRLVLGICNGFQVLLKTGVLLPADERGPLATLCWNDSGKFEDRWVNLRCEESKCVFFAGIKKLYLPVAHAEGKFVVRDDETLQRLAAARQLPLRYERGREPFSGDEKSMEVDNRWRRPKTAPDPVYPENPNGSQANVAGVCDETGRVCGLMPHPERHIEPTQHPRWTRIPSLPAEGDGLAVFRNAVRYFT